MPASFDQPPQGCAEVYAAAEGGIAYARQALWFPVLACRLAGGRWPAATITQGAPKKKKEKSDVFFSFFLFYFYFL
jgi:hypothetical protein